MKERGKGCLITVKMETENWVKLFRCVGREYEVEGSRGVSYDHVQWLLQWASLSLDRFEVHRWKCSLRHREAAKHTIPPVAWSLRAGMVTMRLEYLEEPMLSVIPVRVYEVSAV